MDCTGKNDLTLGTSTQTHPDVSYFHRQTYRSTNVPLCIWKGRKERMRGASPPAALPDDKVDLQLMRLWTVGVKCAAHLREFPSNRAN